MIFRFPHAQFASKMAQDRSKIRSKSNPSRSEPDPIRSNPIQSGPIRSKSGSGSVHGHSRSDPDRSTTIPGRIRMARPGRESPQTSANHPEPSERKPIGLSIVQAKCVVLLYLSIDIPNPSPTHWYDLCLTSASNLMGGRSYLEKH